MGLGEPFGLIAYDQIAGWIPVFLFAMLFGLSMDYEVFLVSRMREEWDATKDTSRSRLARDHLARRLPQRRGLRRSTT